MLALQNVLAIVAQVLLILKTLIVVGGLGWAVFVTAVYYFVQKTQDFNRFSSFGKTIFYVSRYAANVIKRARSSQFYGPLYSFMKRDPVILMLFLGVALVIFVANSVIQSLLLIVGALDSVVVAFFTGALLTGIWRLIGTVLVSGVVFLLSLMLLMFMNYLFGIFARASGWAERYIRPLQRVVEGAGVPANWSFFLLYIILTIFQQAFLMLFFG